MGRLRLVGIAPGAARRSAVPDEGVRALHFD
jgi:hypothetical protein